MSTITLPNIRVGSDLQVRVRLKDGGVAIDWSTLSNIKACIYSDAQRALAGRCAFSIDEEDNTLLVCTYAANKPQYLGVNRIVISAKYMGETKTYDKPAFSFVRWTADQEGEEITIDDPDVDVEITVEDVSSSILQEAVDAAFSAADRANEAAAAAEHMVDIHTGPEGKSAYEVAVEEGYTGTEEEWLASLKGPVGETPDISIGTVTTVEPGTPAAASMSGTPEAPVLNLSIPKGLVGATPNFTVGTVTTGEPGSSVIVTITGTPEAPVLNLTIPQGMQGNTGSSVEYPYELVNNLTTNDATKGLSAAQGYVLDGKVSQLEAKVGDVTYQEIPATITSWTNGKYIYGKDGSVWTSTDNQYATIPVSGATKVRFLGVRFDTAPTSGYGFYDENGVCISSATWRQGASSKQVKEYILDVPESAVTLKVTSWNTAPAGLPITVSDFYCTLISGYTVLDVIDDVETEINGAEEYYGLDTAQDTLVGLPHIYQGKQLKVNGTSAGTALSNVFQANGDNYRNVRVQVVGAESVVYNSFGTSTGYGSFFVDSGDLFISGKSRTTSESNPITLQVPANAKYFIFSYTIANSDGFNHITVNYPASKINTGKITDGAVTSPKIADEAVTKEKLADGMGDIFGQTKNLFDPTDPDFETGYFLNVDGTKSSQSSSAISPYIPLTQGTLVASVNGVQMNYGGYAIVLYNASKQVVTGWQEGTKGYAEWQTNVAYARFTLTNYANGNIQIEQGTTPTSYIPYKKGLDGSKLLPKTVGTDAIADGAITEDKLSGAVLAGGPIAYSSLGGESRVATIASLANARLTITDYPRHLKRSGNISASAYITAFDNIIVGVINGNDNYNALYAKVDATKVYLCRRFPDERIISQVAHGMTISTFVKVAFQYRDNVAKVVVSTLADIKSFDFTDAYIDSYGLPVCIAGENSQLTDVVLRAGSADMRKPVWVFGDSYVSFYSARWPYYLLPERLDIDRYALFGLAGGTSADILPDVEKALMTNTPKFLVWCLGMNDIDTSSEVNASWKSAWDSVTAYCEAKGIIFIGATIPNVPGRRMTFKNDIVRNSGYRYIDFAKAVNAEEAGATWYAGCLDEDNVHPTEAGAKVLCSQVLEDFPEIIDRDAIFD